MREIKRYRMTFKCGDCSNIFKKITTNADLQKAPCPQCRTKNRITKFMRTGDGPISKKDLVIVQAPPSVAPAIIGSIATKAIDATANIVMEDHKLSNLKDSVKYGESMAPRLDPVRQHKADNFFGPKKAPRGTPAGLDPARLAKQAMRGSFRDQKMDPVKALSPRFKPNIEFVNGGDKR